LLEYAKFQLVQFENKSAFCKKQRVEEHDECFAGLIYSESLDAFKSKVEHILLIMIIQQLK
jgi:hypothetical protein